jgi:hypothetical protein
MASPARDARLAAIARGFTEVYSRGRGHLVMKKPGAQQFSLDTQVGDIGWHYGTDWANEVDTAWQASGGSWDWEMLAAEYNAYIRDSVPVSYRYVDAATQHYVEVTWSAVEWVNDEGQSQAAQSFRQVTPVIADDIIRWNDINTANGWDVRVEAQTARLAKWVTIDSLAALGTPTIGGTNIRLRFKLQFTRSSGLDVYVDGVRWAQDNNTWMETSSDIEFRNVATGLPVFWFKRPTGQDAGGNNPAMVQRVRRTGSSIYSEIETPYTWLQNATYPIELDDTIDPQVGASADDGGINTAFTSFGVDGAKYLGHDRNAWGGDESIFGRWQVTGPASGDSIIDSWIE